MIRSCAYLAWIVVLGFQNASGVEDVESPRLRGFEAEYSINRAGITVGKLSRSLVVNNNSRYEFSSVAKATGIAALFSSSETEETSLGSFSAAQIQPERYDHVRRKGGKTKVDQLIFDSVELNLEINRRGVSSQRQLTMGSLDKLSYQLQLMLDLLAGTTNLSYDVETVSKTKSYKADKAPGEHISTPAGKFGAVRIEQSTSSAKRTTFWCSEELGFLPIRVTVLEDGDVTEILLTSYRSSP